LLLAYIDESGDPGPKGPTPYYVVAAVIVKDVQWSSVFEDVLGFRRYLRDQFGLRLRDEVKGAELARGAGAWAKLKAVPGENVRRDIYRGFMRLQAKTGGIRTFAVAVEKAKLKTSDEIKNSAWVLLFERLETYCKHAGDVIMLIPDAGDFAFCRALARRMRRFAMVGSRVQPGTALSRPFVHLVDDPAWRASHESYLIQLADLNAYAAYRHVSPTAKFPQAMWEELDTALVLEVNKYAGGLPRGIKMGPV
jgi:hypothetical protein